MSDPAGSASGPLVVRGGTVVTARGHAPLDVLIRAGQVAALLPRGEPADAASVDADGLLVLPGPGAGQG